MQKNKNRENIGKEGILIQGDYAIISIPKILKTTGSCTGYDPKTKKTVQGVKTFHHEIDLEGFDVERVVQILCHQIKIKHREYHSLPETSVDEIKQMDDIQRYHAQDIYANKIKKRKDPEAEIIDNIMKALDVDRDEAIRRFEIIKGAGMASGTRA